MSRIKLLQKIAAMASFSLAIAFALSCTSTDVPDLPQPDSIGEVTSSSSIGNSSSSSEVSSSNEVSSSSSKLPSSSSSSEALSLCGSTFYNTTEQLCDTRDNKIYKFVEIGTQTWMAENLNYTTSSGSACYNNNNSNCTTYGRLYDWVTAMNLPSSCNSDSCSDNVKTNHNGICPSGWHIPSNAEWTTLENYVGSSKAGGYLKAENGWNSNGNGTDTYGFAALPGGNGSSDGSFASVGNYGNWWSASEYNASNAGRRDMGYNYEYVYSYYNIKSYLYSVRCLKDD